MSSESRWSLDELLSLGRSTRSGGADGDDPGADGYESGGYVSGSLGDTSGVVAGGRSSEDVLRSLPIASLVPNELQPRRRFEESTLQALADSIESLGVLQPVIVRPLEDGRYELIAGERRWRAARRAGLDEVPAVVRRVDDQRSLEEAIVENLHREDLNAIEEAAAYHQLIDDFALTQDEVAVRVGKSRSAVANTLRLFQLPGSVQRMVMDGTLSAGHARALISLPDAHAQRTVASRIATDSLSVREVEDLVKEILAGRGTGQSGGTGSVSQGSGRRKSRGALEVERQLSDLLETKVEVVESATNGRIVIRYAGDEDLARIHQLLLEASDRNDG